MDHSSQAGGFVGGRRGLSLLSSISIPASLYGLERTKYGQRDPWRYSQSLYSRWRIDLRYCGPLPTLMCWRGRYQSTVSDVCSQLEMRGFMSSASLELSIKIRECSDQVKSLQISLGCFDRLWQGCTGVGDRLDELIDRIFGYPWYGSLR